MEENSRITTTLTAGVHEGVFPGAVLLAALKDEVEIFEAAGWAALVPEKRAVSKETVFDIASLTKPLATVLSLMVLMDRGHLDLEAPLGQICSAFLSSPSARTPVKMLLNHCGGMPDWRPYYNKVPIDSDQGKSIIKEAVLSQELEYPLGSREIYSDPGYMLLGWLVEVISGLELDEFAAKNIFEPLGLSYTGFNPVRWENSSDAEFAATEDCPWRQRVILREVHDENAWAAGGVGGHAGLFSTAKEVFTLSRALPQVQKGLGANLYSEATADKFLSISQLVDKSEWHMGLMTPSPTGSSAGRYFSRRSVGHLGYSGCSFWIDPDRELTVVLLTNRVHPTRKNEKIKQFRPVIHDIIYEELIES